MRPTKTSPIDATSLSIHAHAVPDERPPSKRDEIVDVIADGIDIGQYQPEAQLPSEHELAKTYGVSRPTVRTALEKLANDGLIYPAHGRGWFVQRDERLAFPLLTLDKGRAQAAKDVWQTWLEGAERIGSAHLVVTIGIPPRHVRQHLELATGTAECAIRERTRMIEDKPVMISTAYFPMWLAASTELARVGEGDEVDMQDPSPVGLLHRMGHGPVRDEDRIGARRPTRSESDQLELPPGGTVITVCRTSTDSQSRYVRCTADVIAGHRFYLIVTQTY